MLMPRATKCLEAGVQYHFSAIVRHDSDGYWAQCLELQGCYSQGDTYEKALDHLREHVVLHVEDRLSCGEEIPRIEAISLISVEVPG
jgi:predicted RNase H-like HicB family nuclease